MADEKTYLPRDCYSARTVAHMFGQRTVGGEIRPIHRMTLAAWRKSGRIPFIQFNARVICYPRELVDAIIIKANRAND